MDIKDIIGLVICCVALASLIVLLFIVCIPIAKEEKVERHNRSVMYKTITKYLNNFMKDDDK